MWQVSPWIVLAIGVFLGSVFGFGLCALMVISKESDRRWEHKAEQRGGC